MNDTDNSGASEHMMRCNERAAERRLFRQFGYCGIDSL